MVDWNNFGEKVQKWSNCCLCWSELENKQGRIPSKALFKVHKPEVLLYTTATVKHWQRGGLILFPQPAGSSPAHTMGLTGESEQSYSAAEPLGILLNQEENPTLEFLGLQFDVCLKFT